MMVWFCNTARDNLISNLDMPENTAQEVAEQNTHLIVFLNEVSS